MGGPEARNSHSLRRARLVGGIQRSGPFNAPLLPRDQHQGPRTGALRRAQHNLLRDAGQRPGAGRAQAFRASDPTRGSPLRKRGGLRGAPSMLLKAPACALLRMDLANLPLTPGPHPSTTAPSHGGTHVGSKPCSYTDFLSAGSGDCMAAEPSLVWKEDLAIRQHMHVNREAGHAKAGQTDLSGAPASAQTHQELGVAGCRGSCEVGRGCGDTCRQVLGSLWSLPRPCRTVPVKTAVLGNS